MLGNLISLVVLTSFPEDILQPIHAITQPHMV